mmetsp:Transcript_24061/g.51507  ORF Transcript_24061/g.51507 Transcript_24061/m.51507 type:complete len:82 (-) Transcript_24061:511-756(-)
MSPVTVTILHHTFPIRSSVSQSLSALRARPQLEEGSPAWELLAEKNALDIRLYEFVVELFEEQREVIDSYASDGAVETSGG